MVTKKTITQPKTIYVCDNCGAEHSREDSINNDYVTGKEICSKCSASVRLVNRDLYYDKYDKSFGEVYTNYKDVDTNTVQATELDLELDAEEYRNRVTQARQLFMDLLDKIDTEYLKGKVRDFDVLKFVKELS